MDKSITALIGIIILIGIGAYFVFQNPHTPAGRWESVPNASVAAWSAALLPSGKVLLFQNGTQMYLWDPKTKQFSRKFSSNTNLFCAGLALLSDGRLIAVGGHGGKDAKGQFLGLKSAEIFDPWQERWTRLPDMVGGERWYPTALTLSDGRVLVASGTHAGKPNELIEIFDPEQQSWQVAARQRLPMYPWAAVLKSGELVFYGPQRPTYLFSLNSSAFRPAGAMNITRSGGAGVLLNAKTGELLALGGGKPASNSTELFDPAKSAWRATASMAHPRHHANAVLLPDSMVLVVGGHSEADEDQEHREELGAENGVLMAELFDPERESWQEAGQANYAHGYHSTALLLPNGSVLAAGPKKTIEVYYPWYFFAGERPAVESLPSSVTYGQSFSVGTPAAAKIARVVLIRASSTTHSLNTDQRFLELDFQRVSESELLVQAPAHPALAPPGYYLLFLVTNQKIPSEGKFIRIG